MSHRDVFRCVPRLAALGLIGIMALGGCKVRMIKKGQSISQNSDAASRIQDPGAPSPSSTPSPSPSPSQPPTASDCGPLPASTQRNVILVTSSQAGQLPSIVRDAASDSVILLADGTYPVSAGLYFRHSNVTLRSQSDDATKVIIDGRNGYAGGGNDTRVPELVNIAAPNVTVAHVTLRNARDHVIHVVTAGAPTTQVKLYGLRVIDPGEQAIKVNPSGDGYFTDFGEVGCSHIELTATARPWVETLGNGSCYTGGVDTHRSQGWKVYNNTIKGFWCPSGLSEHGIHFWTGSRDTVVEGNRIINCARGIGYGLIDQGAGRNYPDNPCGGNQNMGHYGGVIRNNSIFANDSGLFSSQAGFDGGISIADSCDVKVQHNTIVSTTKPYVSIEYRFSRTQGIEVTQNLASYRILARNGASATLSNNLENLSAAQVASYFVSLSGDGDLHLTPGASSAINAGAPVTGVAHDIDGDARDAQPDLGADEL